MKSLLTAILLLFAIVAEAQIGIGTTSPNSTLDVRGSLSTPITTFTGNTTAGSSDNMLLFTGTSAATLTLPTAASITGREYWIKNASSNSSVLTIATTSAQTIDGLTSWTLTQVNKVIRVVSNGSNWYATSESLPGNSAGTAWLHGGNNVSSIQNIGTTSNYDFPFITNNTERMRLSSAGNLGVGTSTFNGTYPEKLLVDAGTTTSVNAIVGKGSIDSYLQLNIQNNSAGTSASSDVVATANNGNETSNYVDMGINGGSYSGGVMGAANDGYLYTMGNNFLLGTGNASKSLIFMTGGTSQAANERMRIDGSGNVGIGTTNPAYKLQVIAGSNPLYLSGVQTGAGTDSVITINNGIIKRVHPSALVTSSSNAWALTGNTNTLTNNYFLGTTNTDPLVIKTNSTQVGRFDQNSLALGISATTNNSTQSYAMGSTATVGYNKTNAYAIGSSATVNADSSFSIGNSAVTNGANSLAIGTSAAANNTNSVAIGRSAVTAYSISDALAIGTNATANSSNSIAIGSNSTLANKTVTNAASAIAIGNNSISNSANAIAIGTGSSTGYSLTNPVAIGVSALTNGSNGVAIGNGANIGYVSNAMALGAGASATSTANNSTAIGYNASATLANEIILGDRSNTSLSVGIGTESFSGSNREKLLVDAGTTASVNAIVGKGTIDSYLQLNIQNNSSGTSASSDVVATANNGNETSNYIDMGINGGGYTGGVMGSANDGYLYTMGNNFLLGTGNASKSLVFMTGGTSQSTNERMRIDGSGNVGIGTNSPGYKLHVLAASNPLYLLGVQTGASTDSFLTITNGVVKKLHSSALNASSWALDGNSVSSVKSFGTTSAYDLPIITNNTEKMRITSAGDVGIGITSPNYQLHMHKSAAATSNWMQITNNATGTGTYDGFFYGVSAAGQPQIWGEGDLAVYTGSGTTNNLTMTLNANGNVGIGTTSFNGTYPERLIVDAGSTGNTNYQNVIVGKGNTNNYAQLNIQNASTGTAASSDVVATANNGTESVNFIDMGINGGGNTSTGVLGGANTAYIYGTGSDMAIGNATSAKDVILFTGGTATTNERLRATANGLTMTGSHTVSYRSGTGNYTLLTTDYIVINTGAAATWTLPAASGCAGRVYRLLNHGTANVTLSVAVNTANATTTTALAFAAGTNFYEIVSDGTAWRVIN